MRDILLELCGDVSAYSRTKVLQVWAKLCEEHAVSIGLWKEVASVASGRLEDKSAFVRKAALNLLIAMLQHNPFGPQHRTASFEVPLEKFKEKLEEMEPNALFWTGYLQTMRRVKQMERFIRLKSEQQDIVTDSRLPGVEDGVNKDSSILDFGNLEQTRALVASLETCLRFSKCISSTMPTLVQLLSSSSATDVENTILLLMRCRQFQIDDSEASLRKMLPLVFSQDKSIHAAVEDAFIAIYLTRNPTETAANLLSIAI